MNNAKLTTRFRFWLWLIRGIGVIVPRRLRANWQREWEAELRHREEMLAEWDRLDWRAKRNLAWRSASAFWDALWLQPKRLEDEMFQDLRYGMRMLLKNPGFTAVAVLTLALGIGANTAIFSVVNAVLLKPLPYEQPEQLLNLWEAAPWGQSTVSPGAFTDWRDGSTSLEALSVVRGSSMNLGGDGESERLTGLTVCASYLRILRLQPILGRGFLPDEDKPGGDNKVVVIAHGLWQRRFGADPGIIGRKIRLNSEPYMVIGVLPPKAALAGQDHDEDRQFLIPFVFRAGEDYTTRSNHLFNVIARLKPAVTRDQAQAELTALKQRLQPLYPKDKEDWTVKVAPLHESITGAVKPTLLTLMGAVGFVLLIACANVANLLLAKAASRRKEMAIRAAMGAGRWRVIRQMLTESSLLGLLGGSLGVGLAYWGVQSLSNWSGGDLPRVDEVAIDGRALAFSALISVGAGLLFGLVPALQISAPNLNETLKEGSRGSGAGAGHRMRSALIVAEVALALVLLAGAGLLARSLFRLLDVDLGFNPQNTLTMDLSLPKARYPAGSDARSRFLHRIFEKLEGLPGVEAAGMASSAPMAGVYNGSDMKRVDRPEQNYNAPFISVSGNYFSALGIPLLRGRVFSERDDFTNDLNFAKERINQLVVIINEALAKKMFPNEDPLGKRLRFWDYEGRDLEWEIIGIVGNARQTSLDGALLDRFYIPQAFFWQDGSLLIRTKGEPLALAESIRKEILALDSEVPVSNVRTMEQVISGSLSARRFTLTLLGIFAGAALALAVVGLYGVMAYAVSQRTHEIGVRMAFGARRADVLWLILRQGMWLTVLGVAVGLAGALALTRVLRNHLYEIGTTDATTFASVSLSLIFVALLACLIPARRATKVDPMLALRND
ncbi:MAG TPA: ABC transporter permease [Blastocatellia bacterium]|jgi:putative ABC transport system permease protein|nr:ABC transporter permease [Blastocatellia bacterium]